MTVYVAGLLFSVDRKRVALILKSRPEWQRGKLNGIGGHVERTEDSYTAMVREFKEEAGVELKSWVNFCSLRGYDWLVAWYKAFEDVTLSSPTDEQVDWYPVDDVVVGKCNVIPNVRWLVALALDKDNVTASVLDYSS